MVKDKPLTRKELVKTLKEVGVATKDDVRQIVGEEITKRKLASRDDVRQIVKEMGVATKDDLKKFATKDDLVKSENRLERKLVIRMNKMERSLSQSIADFVETTPTRQEFEVLKERVSGKYGLI